MKVLLTGADGQLGRCFQDVYATTYEIIALNSAALDITNLDQVAASVSEHKPQVVVNAAAYTAVDRAEDEPEQAFLVNAQGAKNLAVVCAKLNIELIHISTDYVFDGTKKTPYSVKDAPNPINVYGKSKLAGELLVLAHHPSARIIRTSWVYSEYGHNFLKTMVRLASEGKEVLTVVSDQYGCPTYAGNLAQAIGSLIDSRPSACLYHYTDDDEMSWYDFAKQIFMILSVQDKYSPVVTPISSAQYPVSALRPQYSTLTKTLDINNNIALRKVVELYELN